MRSLQLAGSVDEMSHSKPVQPPRCDLQNTISWTRKAHEDLFCGEEINISDGQTKAVLSACSVVICDHMNVTVLVKYLMKRRLLTDDEVWLLNQPRPPKANAIELLQMLSRKGVNGFHEFYACLLESYMMEGGVDGHYAIIKTIQMKVRYHCGINPEVYELTALSIRNRIKVIAIPVDQAQRLLRRLSIAEACDIPSNNPTTLDVYDCWLSVKQSHADWTELVEAFLMERGLGYFVSGVQPIGSSNPPVVCNYVRSLLGDWVFFAQHLGLPNYLIEGIQHAYSYNLSAQIQAFLRECLIPDCGDERTRIMMRRVEQEVNVPKVKEKARDALPPPLESVDKKEYHVAKGPSKDSPVYELLQQPQMEQQRRPYGTPSKLEHPIQEAKSLSSVPAKAFQDQWNMKPHNFVPPKVVEGTHSTKFHPSLHPIAKSNAFPEERNQETQSDGNDLLEASTSGLPDLATALIISGSNLEAQTKNGRTPLLLWCEKNNVEVVGLLLEQGADIRTKDNDGNTCLHMKEALKNPQMVALLVQAFWEKQISVGLANKNGLTPLVLCCQVGDMCCESARLLVTHSADVDGSPNCRPLIYAAARGSEKIVTLLLTYGANVNQQDREQSTALIQSCLFNHTSLAKLLVERGANVNKADKSGMTALVAAVTKNLYEVAEVLIDKGAHVNVSSYITKGVAQGEVEATPLAIACRSGFEDIAGLLVKHGAKVNYMCSGQVPPIGFAIICRHNRMVKFMLGLSEFNKTIYGLIVPMRIAMNAENYHAVNILLEELGGADNALLLAERSQLWQFAEQIQIFKALAGEMSFPSDLEPTQMIGDRVKVEETLQHFSQIVMSAVTANTDRDSLMNVVVALDAPHVAKFFEDYYDHPPRPDVLKSQLLSRDCGMSPFNLLVQHQLLDAVQFQMHALEYFPEGPDQFYNDLVWAFHTINGGENLPWDVESVLRQLFGFGFQLSVQTSTVGHAVQPWAPTTRNFNREQTQVQPWAPTTRNFNREQTQGWGSTAPGITTGITTGIASSGTMPMRNGIPMRDYHSTTPTALHRPMDNTHSASSVEQDGRAQATVHSPTMPMKHSETKTGVREVDFAGKSPDVPLQEITDERTSVPQPSQYPSPTTTTTNLKPDSREVLTQQPQHSAHDRKRRSSHEHSSDINPPVSPLVHQGTLSKPVATVPPSSSNAQPRDCSKSVPDEVMLHSPHLATNRESQSEPTPPRHPPSLQPSKIPRPVRVYRQCSTPQERPSRSKRQREPIHPRPKAVSPLARGKQLAKDTKSKARAVVSRSHSTQFQPPKSELIKQLLQNNPEMKGMIKKTRSTGVYLGSGSYGEVAEVVSPQGTVYAAKKFWMSQRQEQFLKMFVKEVKLLSRLNHPNIVKYHGISIEARTDALLLLMERLQTNLSVYLLSDSPPDYPRKLSILKDVAAGLSYLHAQDPAIIHRDLTAKNVLLDSHLRAKIADFGNARIAQIDSGGHKTMTGHPGTQPYMPPEACQSKSKYNKKIDVFSFGHLALFTMIQESPEDILPYKDYDQGPSPVVLTEIQRREKYMRKLYQELDERHPLVTMIKKCLHDLPRERPSAYTVVSKLEDIIAH